MKQTLLRQPAKQIDVKATTLAIEHLEPRRLMIVDLAPMQELLAVPGFGSSRSRRRR